MVFAKRFLGLAGLLLLIISTTANAGPQIQKWTTSNGTKVLFVQAKELPIVDVQIVFDAGSIRDGMHKGLANMTNSLLDEGAGKLDANAIAARFEDVGAQFGLDVSREMATVSLRSLSDKSLLKQATDTVAMLLSKPTFPQNSLDRIRKNNLIGLKQEKQNPGRIADKAFYHNLYTGHPYASDPIGTQQSLTAMTRDEVKAFFKRYYVANNAVMAIVGDLNRPAAEALAEKLVSGLAKGRRASPVPNVANLHKAKNVFIDYKSTQTHVLMGQPGISRKDPDYFPLYVGNYILGGGGLVSRLSDEVREKRGLSYSVYSYFYPLERRGPYVMGLQTRSDQTQKALAVMRDTIRKFVKEGPTAAELKAAKQHISGGFALRIDSNKKTIGYLAVMAFYDLPLDFLDTYVSKVEAVSLEDIRRAFMKRVHPDEMVSVIVGPPVSQKAQASAEHAG